MIPQSDPWLLLPSWIPASFHIVSIALAVTYSVPASYFRLHLPQFADRTFPPAPIAPSESSGASHHPHICAVSSLSSARAFRNEHRTFLMTRRALTNHGSHFPHQRMHLPRLDPSLTLTAQLTRYTIG